jgi:hypothetical protein
VNILAIQVTPGGGKSQVRFVVDAEAKMNINHVYSGLDPSTNTPILIFGVGDAGRALTILEQAAASAAHR